MIRPLTYSKMHVLMASPTEPTPKKIRDSQLLRMRAGLHAIEKEPEPTRDDWRVLSDCVNLMETLIEMGHIKDDSGLLPDAIAGLAKAGKRSVKGGHIRLDAAGIAAVRAALEDYEMCLENIPHRVMVECHRLTEQRIRDILAGKKKPHDVEIVSY